MCYSPNGGDAESVIIALFFKPHFNAASDEVTSYFGRFISLNQSQSQRLLWKTDKGWPFPPHAFIM